MAALSSDPASFGSLGSSQNGEETSRISAGDGGSSQEEEPESSQTEEHAATELVELANTVKEGADSTIEGSVHSEPVTLRRNSSCTSGHGLISSSGPESAVKSFTSTPGYLSNRWNSISSSFSTPASTQETKFATPDM